MSGRLPTVLNVLNVLKLFVVSAALAVSTTPFAAQSTECTTNLKLCYCVNQDFLPVIEEKVKLYRAQIADARAKGKAVGYMSLPLSTLGGGFFGVNADVARKTKERIEERFGASSVWVLNPGAKESDLSLPSGARGTNDDYMLLWTRVLEGVSGLGEDFDFVYFVGPSDFGAYFGLTGTGDMDKIMAYFDERLAKDPALKREVDRGRVSRTTFRNYYGLKASITVSNGAHEEWNIFRTLNERRRADAKYGIGNQVSMIFDGKAMPPAIAEIGNTPGISGACKVKP